LDEHPGEKWELVFTITKFCPLCNSCKDRLMTIFFHFCIDQVVLIS
jgi:hypothetical protein